MTTIFFTSDPHFGHNLVAGLRGFDSHVEHDEALCDNFVSRVTKRDTTWWLGDISMSPSSYMIETIAKLPGIHHLVAGNHDACHPMHRGSHKNQRKYFEAFASVQSAAVVSIAGSHVLLSHFPYDTDREQYEKSRFPQWRLRDEGAWLLHGHTHAAVQRTGEREIHVGLDAWDLAPVEINTVRKLMEEQ